MPNRRGYEEFRRGWRTLGAVTIAASFGFPTLAFFSIGIFAPTFADEFGWTMGAIMGGIFLASIVILLLGPVVGRHIDKHEPKLLASLSLVGFGIGYISLAFSSGSILQYYLSWTIMSVAGVGATAISFTHIVTSTFQDRRGLALGIALSSSGFSAMLVKPLAGLTVALFGWRETIVLIGLLPIFVGAPVLMYGVRARTTSSDMQSNNYTPPKENLEGVTVIRALRDYRLWILLAAFTAIAFGNGAPIPNLENILRTHRFSPVEIVELTSLVGFSLIAGRILGGWLIDHIWAPLVGLVLLVSAALGCWLLAGEGITYSQTRLSIILISVAAGTEYDLLSFLVARYLGRRHYGAIYSLVFGVFAISTGIGPVVLGYFYDRHSSYEQGLMICTAMLAFAGLILLGLGRYPEFRNDSHEAVGGVAD